MNIYTMDQYGEYNRITLPHEKIIKQYHFIKQKLYNQLDKINHPIICKLTHRHKRPEEKHEQKYWIPSGFNCVRCGERCNFDAIIGQKLWESLNSELNLWAELSKDIWTDINPPPLLTFDPIHIKQTDTII